MRIINGLGNMEEIETWRIPEKTLSICLQKCNFLSEAYADSRCKVLIDYKKYVYINNNICNIY